MSHAQVSAKWHESDHTDPIKYLASCGKIWVGLVADVAEQYKVMELDETVDEGILVFGPDDLVTAKTLVATLGNEVAIFMRKSDGTAPVAIKTGINLGTLTSRYHRGDRGYRLFRPLSNKIILSKNDKHDTNVAIIAKMGTARVAPRCLVCGV